VHPEHGRAPILNKKNQGAGAFRMCPRAGSLGRFVGKPFDLEDSLPITENLPQL